MIRILNCNGLLINTEYRLGQLEQALDDIRESGFKITNTIVDLEKKNLDITVLVSEEKPK